MASFWRKIVEGRWAINMANLVAVPRERRLQERLDMQKLFVLLQMHQATSGGKDPAKLQHLLLQAQTAPADGTRRGVDAAVRAQLLHMAAAVHEALNQLGEPTTAAAQLAQAAGTVLPTAAAAAAAPGSSGSSNPRPQEQQPSSSTSTSSSSEHLPTPSGFSSLLQKSLGFSLRLGPSSIPHPEAGLGVFLQGQAPPGSIVAIVPGLAYARTQYTHMPNYPRIDLNNPYLSRRYDMTIMDSKPWGSGPQARGPWPLPTCPEADALLGALEGRQPYALGHMVNHPGKGMHPNVLEVAFDFEVSPGAGEAPWLRAYLPCAPFIPWEDLVEAAQEEEDKASLRGGKGSAGETSSTTTTPSSSSSSSNGSSSSSSSSSSSAACSGGLPGLPRLLLPGRLAGRAPGIALVATRAIRDGEEILQNYRLNPNVPQPPWYEPYDVEEERRRWARLTWLNLTAARARAS